MVLYADVLFAINFSMDFLSLFLCSILLHLRIKRIRAVLSSLIGAAYAFFQMVISLGVISTILSGVAVAMIMILVAFSYQNLRRALSQVAVYLLVTALLGGVMSALYSLMNRALSSFIESYSYDKAYDTARLWIIISLTAVISVILSKILVSKKDVKSAEITVFIKERKFNLTALVDSGNMLRDPLSGKCVILVSEGSEIGQEIEKFEEIYKKYIPYRDVNGEGLLKGISPNEIIINGKSVSAIVATVKSKSFDGNDALLPSALM